MLDLSLLPNVLQARSRKRQEAPVDAEDKKPKARKKVHQCLPAKPCAGVWDVSTVAKVQQLGRLSDARNIHRAHPRSGKFVRARSTHNGVL